MEGDGIPVLSTATYEFFTEGKEIPKTFIDPPTPNGIMRAHFMEDGVYIYAYFLRSGAPAFPGKFFWAGQFGDDGFAVVQVYKNSRRCRVNSEGRFSSLELREGPP